MEIVTFTDVQKLTMWENTVCFSTTCTAVLYTPCFKLSSTVMYGCWAYAPVPCEGYCSWILTYFQVCVCAFLALSVLVWWFGVKLTTLEVVVGRGNLHWWAVWNSVDAKPGQSVRFWSYRTRQKIPQQASQRCWLRHQTNPKHTG